MNYLSVYTAIAVALLLLLFIAPLALLIASNDPVACLGRALNDLALSVAITKPPLEFQHRDGLLVVVVRWPDLGPLLNSFLVPLLVSSAATLLGLTYSLIVYLYRVPRLLAMLPLLAYLPVPFVKVAALQSLLDPDIGLLNRAMRPLGLAVRVEGLAAVALYQLLTLFPFSYSIHSSYALMLPKELAESAYSLGSTPRTVAARVLMPLLRPASLTSLALTYVLSLEDLEAPLIFEGYPDVRGLLSYRAYVHFISEVYSGFSQRAIGYTLLLLTVTAAVFAASAKYLVAVYRSFGAALAKPPSVYRSRLNVGVAPALIMLFLVLATAISPTVASLAYAFVDPITLKLSPSLHLLVDPSRIRASLNTAVYTSLSLFCGLAIALPLAYWASRKRKLHRLIEAVSVAPLSIPGVAVAYSYIGLFGGFPVNPFNSPWLYLVLSYTLRRLTYVYIVLRNAISSIPQDYEETAQSLGAGPATALLTAVAPLALSTSTLGLSLVAVSIATEVSTSVTIGSLGPTQGWGSTAPLVYAIYRDITSAGVAIIGAYTIAVLVTVLVSVLAMRLALVLITRGGRSPRLRSVST